MLKPLTSLRFVFAYMVFSGYLGGLFLSYNEEFLKESFASYLSISDGYLGVSFFFILSGFILAYNYKEPFLKKTISFKKFILLRLFRLYPLHILTFLAAAYLSYYNQLDTLVFWIKSFSNLFLVQSFIPLKEFYFSFNGVSWSISNELFFYVMFPLLLLLIAKVKKYSLLLLLVPLIIIIVRASVDVNHWDYYINPLFRIFDFFLGVILHDIYKEFKNKPFLKGYPTLLEIAAIVLFIAFYSFRDNVSQEFRWSLYYWIPMIFIIFIFALQRGSISTLLSKSVFLWLGKISFSFYMIHQLVINVLWILNYKFRFFENGYLLIGTALLVSIIGSGFIHSYFEEPLNRFLRKKYISK